MTHGVYIYRRDNKPEALRYTSPEEYTTEADELTGHTSAGTNERSRRNASSHDSLTSRAAQREQGNGRITGLGIRPFALEVKTPPRIHLGSEEGPFLFDHSAVNGSSAIVLALLIAVVSWR